VKAIANADNRHQWHSLKNNQERRRFDPMEKVKAEALTSNFVFGNDARIDRVERSSGLLKIHVTGGLGEQGCVITFENPLGFRVVDERDLMEYWPVCSTPAGWIFQIHSGGWLEQERRRPGSLMPDTYPDVKEYLITSIEDCVSVFSLDAPTLTALPSDLA
jgi:hypothetical protein